MRHDSAHHATDAEQLQDATECSTDTDATHNAKCRARRRRMTLLTPSKQLEAATSDTTTPHDATDTEEVDQQNAAK